MWTRANYTYSFGRIANETYDIIAQSYDRQAFNELL